MKVAIIGMRGIPLIYSGFEIFAEKLSSGLKEKGYDVTVYCRSPYFSEINKSTYKGVNRIFIPTLKQKHLETFIHSFLSTLHACFIGKYNVVYYFGVGNALFALLPRLFRTKVLINVDGLDSQRKKWGVLAKIYLRFSEYLATVFPNDIVTDSLFMRKYYKKIYGKNGLYIPYGHEEHLKGDQDILSKLALDKEQYFVWVGRLVPENDLDQLLQAYQKIDTPKKCIIIGDDLYGSNYKEKIIKLAKQDRRIVMAGFLPRNDYLALLKNSYAYIETKHSGGSHPSLIEAMGSPCLILADDHPANKEVLGGAAIFYSIQDKKDMVVKLKNLLEVKREQTAIMKRDALRIAKMRFSWKDIVDVYDKTFRSI